MHDHDPDDAEMRAWLADGKAPPGVCPHCGSRVSVVQRDGHFRARCSHRGCGASGPRMPGLGRAVEAFCRPPAYVARHMGIDVHPSSLTDVVSVLEHDRDAAVAEINRLMTEATPAENARLTASLTYEMVENEALRTTLARLTRERDEARGLLGDMLSATAWIQEDEVEPLRQRVAAHLGRSE